MTRSKKPSRLFLIISGFSLLLFVSIASVSALYLYLKSPADPNNSTPQVFVIKKGESITNIGQRLYQSGLIKNVFLFKAVVWQQGLTNKIQAGDFKLQPDQSLINIAHNLTHGTLDLWITTIEGWRREEIAAALTTEFQAQGIDFNTQDFISLTADLEGHLFPDTYLIPRNATPQTIIDIFTANFDKKIDQTIQDQVTFSGHTLKDIIIMASIVEREARGSARPIVAGILWQRLDNDWPLQADATLQYLKGYSRTQNTWWPTPVAADKNSTSLFNTYKYPGLPPSPICNPSLESIQAAADPQSTDYWYYLSDTQGQMHYSETLEEHNAKIQKYLR